MKPEELRQMARDIIKKEKWWDMLSRFIDVLRINIFVVDSNGLMILPPEEGRYGGRLLNDRALKFDLVDDAIRIDELFEPHGMFLESNNRYGLSSFAIPIKINDQQIIAYLIVGPVILNKRLSSDEYDKMALDCECDKSELANELGGIRVVSNIMMNSILDLMAEIVRDNIELAMKKSELRSVKAETGGLSDDFTESAQEMYSTVYMDELLATLLDVALKMTNAPCGSIMVRDSRQDELTIRVSRGLNQEKIQGLTVKLGEGIAGIAASENRSFIIRGTQGDSQIKHLLKRPEIKEALVMPLKDKNRVFGVLNLHTTQEGADIAGNFNNLKYLSELLPSAL